MTIPLVMGQSTGMFVMSFFGGVYFFFFEPLRPGKQFH